MPTKYTKRCFEEKAVFERIHAYLDSVLIARTMAAMPEGMRLKEQREALKRALGAQTKTPLLREQ